jgi:ribose-phosphate pyrophosphokinase
MTGLRVLAFAGDEGPAGRLAAAMNAPLDLIDLHRFPDGEVLPTVPPSAGTTVLYRSLDRPNDKLASLLLAADAARRAGARRLVLAAPYLCYLRQDAVFRPGQPLSRDVILPLVGAPFDRIVTVQAHLHRTFDLGAALGVTAQNLDAAEALTPLLAAGDRPLVVGPDAESEPWAQDWARRLRGQAVTFAKTRRGDRDVGLAADWLGKVRGRRCVLFDDVASSGVTLARAARLLAAAGAAAIDVAVVHALFDRRAEARLRQAGARRIISTDSAAHPTNAAALAPLLARALQDEPDRCNRP